MAYTKVYFPSRITSVNKTYFLELGLSSVSIIELPASQKYSYSVFSTVLYFGHECLAMRYAAGRQYFAVTMDCNKIRWLIVLKLRPDRTTKIQVFLSSVHLS